MTGPGRPKVGPMVNVRIPPDLLRRLDIESQRAGERRAATIRRLLGERLRGDESQDLIRSEGLVT